MINEFNYQKLKEEYANSQPFSHCIIDNFFEDEYALQLADEFPDYNDPNIWAVYDNPIEVKKLTPSWGLFPKTTYRMFTLMNTPKFVEKIRYITGIEDLVADYGMHGGGWHMHTCGGKLNLHRDYSIHPKLNMERRINIIVYMTPDWKEEWGGGLELWSHDLEKNRPKECVTKVYNKFNRAILFDTASNSWHGLPNEIQCPDGVYRKSFAIYYISPVREGAETNDRAYFVPTSEQENDLEVLKLIEKRSNTATSKDIFKAI